MKQYAIVSPAGGFKEDLPSILIDKVYTPGYPTKNVLYENGLIRKGKGRGQDFVTLTGSREVNMLAHFEKTTIALGRKRYFIVGSKDKIYYWNGTAWADITGAATFTGTETDIWSFTPYGEYFIFTNGKDGLYKWGGTGNIAILGGTPPNAKYVAQFKNYVVAANVAGYYNRVAWSAIGEMENWTTGDSGEAIVDDVQPIMGLSATTNYLVIFKQFSIYIMNMIGGDLVFSINKRVERVGCHAPHSITELNNQVYFFGSNKRIYMFDGIEAHDISASIQDMLAQIKESNFGLIHGITIDSLNRLVWLIPKGNVTRNNYMVVYDVNIGAWFQYEIEGTVMGVGGYEVEADDTWNTMLAQPGITWATIDPDRQWDDISYSSGERVNVIGSTDGKVYRMFYTVDDKGADFTGTFVTKKVEFGAPNVVRRVLQLQHYFKNEGVDRSVTISARIDNEPTFETGETFDLNGGTDDEFVIFDQYVDYVCKTLQLKIEGSDNWQYIGTIFSYEDLGYR